MRKPNSLVVRYDLVFKVELLTALCQSLARASSERYSGIFVGDHLSETVASLLANL